MSLKNEAIFCDGIVFHEIEYVNLYICKKYLTPNLSTLSSVRKVASSLTLANKTANSSFSVLCLLLEGKQILVLDFKILLHLPDP